jgi:hypothetical protein
VLYFVLLSDSFDLAGCWASSGYSVQGCAQLEQALRECMDAPVSRMLRIDLTIAHWEAKKDKANLVDV